MQRLRREHNDRMRHAFFVAALPSQKRPVKLDELLISIGDEKPRRRQTIEEQIAIAHQWTAAASKAEE